MERRCEWVATAGSPFLQIDHGKPISNSLSLLISPWCYLIRLFLFSNSMNENNGPLVSEYVASVAREIMTDGAVVIDGDIDSGLGFLRDAIRDSRTIRHFLLLNLIHDNAINPTRGQFFQFLTASHPTIIEVLLVNCNLGTPEIRLISESIKTNQTMELINLTNNVINGLGAGILTHGLYRNDSLKKIILNSNPIGDTGAKAFAKYIAGRKVIDLLHLCNCGITQVGGISIGEALKEGRLRRLFIGKNKIKDKGARSISRSLRCNKYLKRLQVNNNQLTNWSCRHLALSLRKNCTLSVLELEGNMDMTDEGYSWFKYTLSNVNFTLHDLVIPYQIVGSTQQEINDICNRNKHALEILNKLNYYTNKNVTRDLLSLLVSDVSCQPYIIFSLLKSRTNDLFTPSINKRRRKRPIRLTY